MAAIPSDYVGSGIATRSSGDVSTSTNTTSFIIAVPSGFYSNGVQIGYPLQTLSTPTLSIANATGIITATATVSIAGYYITQSKNNTLNLTTQAGTTITPSETAQTAVASYRWTTGTVTVAAISSTYVGSGVTTRSSADLSASAYVITAPSGYYSTNATFTMTQYDLTSPTMTIANATGVITATATIPSNKVGYYSSQYADNTLTLTTQAGTTITPKATSQTAVASYRWTTGTITVAAVPTDTNNTFSANGTYTPASGKWFDSVTISVPSGAPLLQARTVTYSPSETAQTATVSAATGYDGLSQVTINVQAIPTTYVGSGITERTSLATNANTVTASAGYYPSAVTYTVPAMTVPTSTSASGSGTRKITATPNTATQYINLPTGYNSATAYFQINPIPSSYVQPTYTKAAATYTPGTAAQTISANTYLTGAQTIQGDEDLVGSNIISTANIFGVQGTVVINKYYTGTSAPASTLGSNGDIYFQS